MKGEGRSCSTLLPPNSASFHPQHPSLWADDTSLGAISTLSYLRNNEEQAKSSEKHFLLGTGPAAASWDMGMPMDPSEQPQGQWLRTVQPLQCPHWDALSPSPVAHSSMRAGSSWQRGPMQDMVSWQWSLLRHPHTPQRYLSSLMPAVAPRYTGTSLWFAAGTIFRALSRHSLRESPAFGGSLA